MYTKFRKLSKIILVWYYLTQEQNSRIRQNFNTKFRKLSKIISKVWYYLKEIMDDWPKSPIFRGQNSRLCIESSNNHSKIPRFFSNTRANQATRQNWKRTLAKIGRICKPSMATPKKPYKREIGLTAHQQIPSKNCLLKYK